MRRVSILLGTLSMTTLVFGADFSIASDSTDASGIRNITLQSPYQPGKVLIRIVAPQDIAAADEKRFLYVLPVEPREERLYGDGLAEVIKDNLQNPRHFIIVAPSFAQLPWYADHASNPDIRQESYFLKSVLPAVESLYPAKTTRRVLLGFSKSGFGAYSLILRHPEMFEVAAVWDAPLMKEKPDQFGMKPIFGTQENFERCQVSKLLRENGEPFKKTKRLYLAGYGNFRKHTQDAHALMESLSILHEYADGPQQKHIWGSGWIPNAIQFLDNATK